jgi:hypothetical protein
MAASASVRVLKVPLSTMLRIGIAHDVVLVNRHRFRERRDGGKGNERAKGDYLHKQVLG